LKKIVGLQRRAAPAPFKFDRCAQGSTLRSNRK